MDYQKELLAVYRKHYPGGVCMDMEKCSKEMPSRGHRCSISLLGCDYGKSGLAKIMFVGKEGVSDCGGATALNIYEPIAIEDTSCNNWHYICTIYSAALLFSKTEQLKAEEISLNRMRRFSDLRHLFCLTNYYKCAFKSEKQANKHHNIKTNREMTENCAKILLDEIQAIRPDIIVIQGKFYSSSFWNKKGLQSFSVGEDIYKAKEQNVNISVSKYTHIFDQSVFYVIWSYHPCAQGRKWFHTLPAFHEAIEIVKKEMKKRENTNSILGLQTCPLE